jgi:hypothetical protein
MSKAKKEEGLFPSLVFVPIIARLAYLFSLSTATPLYNKTSLRRTYRTASRSQCKPVGFLSPASLGWPDPSWLGENCLKAKQASQSCMYVVCGHFTFARVVLGPKMG